MATRTVTGPATACPSSTSATLASVRSAWSGGDQVADQLPGVAASHFDGTVVAVQNHGGLLSRLTQQLDGPAGRALGILPSLRAYALQEGART